MDLKEFVIDTFIENRIEYDDVLVEETIKKINEYARDIHEHSHDDIVAISDSDVRKFILDSETALKELQAKQQEEKEKREAEEQARKETLRLKKEEEANRKAIEEHKPIQMGLF